MGANNEKMGQETQLIGGTNSKSYTLELEQGRKKLRH